MAKETILTYLDTQLTKKFNEENEYDVAIDWDTRNHTIELVIRLFAENKEHEAIDDKEGIVSEEEIIEFEDGILLYDSIKSTFDEEDYLAAFPFERKKGINRSVLDAIVAYLPEVLEKGQDDLLDFLESEDEGAVFELEFDDARFAELLQEAKDVRADSLLPYPSY